MNLQTLLTRCKEIGLTMRPEDGRLKMQAPNPPPEELLAEIRRQKPALMELLTVPDRKKRPFIENGELKISPDVDGKYRWWAGGQSVAATLYELGAHREMWARHTEVPRGPVH